ncbi:hypothetical protein [Microbacterium sp. C7(2022)]|uniref:hypothetical protein n=1 Tax=Microbacterium sp. C7(2022) TaxID=2992759 RepID=UPI00237BF55E|nr:hypothetical protein [Microbacterium sp. C7(2022)]MDE0546277.1 hypothetical protein [Microbacterium sp. C7(2022)]
MIWDGCLEVAPVGYDIVRDSCEPSASTVPLGVVFTRVRNSCVVEDAIVRGLRHAPA